jgi:SulP family sulfate permease
VKGPLFFGSTGKFSTLFDSKRDPDQVVLDFSSCRVWDHSALEAIHDTVDKYGTQGKTVFLRNLSDEMADMLAKSHPSGSLPACVHLEDDPDAKPVNPYAEKTFAFSTASQLATLSFPKLQAAVNNKCLSKTQCPVR